MRPAILCLIALGRWKIPGAPAALSLDALKGFGHQILRWIRARHFFEDVQD